MEALKVQVQDKDVVQGFIAEHIGDVQGCLAALPRDVLGQIVDRLAEAGRKGQQVFIFGNGGSASTASHMACDLGKGAIVDGHPRLKVMSLNDNMAIMTAISNDISYEAVFIEQLKNLLKPDDVIIAISASGNSPNVVNGMEYAREVGAYTVGLIGFGGGKMAGLSDLKVVVDSYDYGVVEGLHLVIEHMISFGLKAKLAASASA